MSPFIRVTLAVFAIMALTTEHADAQQPDPNDVGGQWYLFSGGANYIGLGLTGPTGGWQYSHGPGVGTQKHVAVVDGGSAFVEHNDLKRPNGQHRVISGIQWNDHATNIAGVIAATTNNGIGIAGIDWNSQLNSIDASRVNEDDPTPDTVYMAVISLADNQYKVVNHSYGTEDFSLSLLSGFVYSYNHDVVTVAATGNTGGYAIRYPAAYPGIIAVGSILRNGQRSSSSAGWHVDVVAPSANENSSINDKIYTLFPNNGYGHAWGTSMAAPQVTGAVSLLRAWKPELSNDDVEWVLKLSARPAPSQTIVPDSVFGYGLVRADSAFALLSSPYTLWQDSIVGPPDVWTSGQRYIGFVRPGGNVTLYAAFIHELRINVSFPKPLFRFIGAWVRGSKSTGYALSAEGEANDGRYFAEFVPGTLTPEGGTLRTYVYDLYAVPPASHHYGFSPAAPSEAVISYSVWGEELLETPALYVTMQGGNHRLTWADGIDFESNWHVDRKEGNGSWQVDYAVLPANSTSFTDSASGLLGSELYEYRIYPSTPSQTGSNSNVVSLRAKPKAPSCVSGYVVQMNTLANHPVEYCSACNTSECGGIGGPMEMLGEGSFGEELLDGEEMMQSIGGPPGCPSGCQKTNMLVVEWNEPENQILGAIDGYRVVRFDDDEQPFWTYGDLTTHFVDTMCSEQSSEVFELGVIAVDEYGGTSLQTTPVYLTTGSLDYCGGYGTPQEKPVADADVADALPKTFALRQNHPNPFNAGTVIEYDLPVPSDVELEVFDVLGRRVVGLAYGYMPAGKHALVWDGRNSNGDPVSSGVYFYRFAADAFVHTRKLVVLK